MTKKGIHFMGILANVDSSILKVKLDHGFKIENMSCDEGVELIHTLTKCDRFLIPIWLHPCIEITPHQLHDQLYFISNSFENIYKFQPEEVITYLIPTIKLMRLFKEGNISIPFRYYFRMYNKTPKLIMFETTSKYIGIGPKYTLKDSEIPDLQEFLQNTKLPFKEPFLKLAFENYELSYETHDVALRFLSLVVSLETLFYSGGGKVKAKISKNTATLLGKNEKNSKDISSKIKELYEKRCDIIHEGKTNIVKNEDLLNLRYYVRESIKEIYKIGKNKNDILDTLNSCGFGEKPWRNE